MGHSGQALHKGALGVLVFSSAISHCTRIPGFSPAWQLKLSSVSTGNLCPVPWDTEWRWVNLSACHMLLDFLSLNSSCFAARGFSVVSPSLFSFLPLSSAPVSPTTCSLSLLLLSFYTVSSLLFHMGKINYGWKNKILRHCPPGSQGTVFNFLCRVTVIFCCRLHVALSGIMYLLT